MDTLKVIMGHPAFLGAMSGFFTAVKVDYDAFTSWKSWDKIKAYNWSIASFRWFQGIIIGAAGAYGIASGVTAMFGQ